MALVFVESPRNHLLKEYKKLQKSTQYRQKSKQIALEGPNLLREALKAGLKPEVVFWTGDYYKSEGGELFKDLPPVTQQVVLSSKLFKSIASTKTPQAVAAIVPFDYKQWMPSVKGLQLKLVMILDRLRDPGNMGTLIRTAAAAGVDSVFYSRGSVDPYSPKVLRSTAGSIFHLPVLKAEKPLEMIRELKKNGFSVAAATAHQGVNLWEANFDHKTALIVGNEAGGLDKSLLDAVDLKVTIPLAEPVESLNAAVASAVILFEIIRRRRS